MMTTNNLKELIAAPEILILPGVYDAFSARVVQSHGYKAAMLTGGGISESHLGFPDLGIMGLRDNLEITRSIAARCDLLLIADGDTGYGNAVNVYHTVESFERAGVAGVMIEDQTWPKKCGHMAGRKVIELDEMLGKVRAAVKARSDPALVIMARTDALEPLGFDAAVDRANRYADAGADLLFADGLLSVEQIEGFAKRVHAPVSINMGFGLRTRKTTPLMGTADLQDLGVAVVEYPRMLTSAAINGMNNALEALKESPRISAETERSDLQVSFEYLQSLMGLEELQEMEEEFSA